MHKKLKVLALGLICSIVAGNQTSLAMDPEKSEFVRLTASERGTEALVRLYQTKAELAQARLIQMEEDAKTAPETHDLSLQLVRAKLKNMEEDAKTAQETHDLSLQLVRAKLKNMDEDAKTAPETHQLSLQLLQAKQQSVRVQTVAQEIMNRRTNESFFEHIGRPDTIVRITLALFPLALTALQKYWSEAPAQEMIEQKIQLNNITIEQAKLDLQAKKNELQAQDMMTKLAIKNEAIKLQKEETKLQVATSLTSLAKKEANGEELSDKEKQLYEVCHKVLHALVPKVDTQEAAVAAAA